MVWFGISAQQKNQFAEYALGCLYLKGEDVPKYVAKAVSYSKSAAIRGNEFAEYLLGKIYLVGEDIPKDVETALQYLTASANQGNQYAQYTLGKLYLMGKDIPKDKEEVLKWFTLSAARGNIYAQFFLDNDEVGHKASERLKNQLTESGYGSYSLISQGKDWNDDLINSQQV